MPDQPDRLPATAGYDDAALAKIAADIPSEWLAAFRLAGRIHNTVFVPEALRGDPSSVMACILKGSELGLGPMQSLELVHVIKGRPSLSAVAMRGLVNRAGHLISVVEAKQDRVTLEGHNRSTGATATVTWTMDDAKAAKLTGNPAWQLYPRSMLLARATSELCRQIFADVIHGMCTPDEVAAIEAVAWEPAPGELVDPITSRPVSIAEVELADDLDDEDERWVREAAGDHE